MNFWSFLGLLMLIAFVIKFWWVILLVVLGIVGVYALKGIVEQQRKIAAADREARAKLSARADQQHRWVEGGDDRGIYGEYPPARL